MNHKPEMGQYKVPGRFDVTFIIKPLSKAALFIWGENGYVARGLNVGFEIRTWNQSISQL